MKKTTVIVLLVIVFVVVEASLVFSAQVILGQAGPAGVFSISSGAQMAFDSFVLPAWPITSLGQIKQRTLEELQSIGTIQQSPIPLVGQEEEIEISIQTFTLSQEEKNEYLAKRLAEEEAKRTVVPTGGEAKPGFFYYIVSIFKGSVSSQIEYQGIRCPELIDINFEETGTGESKGAGRTFEEAELNAQLIA